MWGANDAWEGGGDEMNKEEVKEEIWDKAVTLAKTIVRRDVLAGKTGPKAVSNGYLAICGYLQLVSDPDGPQIVDILWDVAHEATLSFVLGGGTGYH